MHVSVEITFVFVYTIVMISKKKKGLYVKRKEVFFCGNEEKDDK